MGELDVVLKTLIAEAANQDDEGMYAVASTFVNRAKRRKKTLEQIVNQPHQYTGRWRTDLDAFVSRQPPEVIERARAALQRAIESPMQGVDHYLTNQLYKSPKAPSWSRKMGGLKEVGDHTFMDSFKEAGEAKMRDPNALMKNLYILDKQVFRGLFGTPLQPQEMKMIAQGMQNPKASKPPGPGMPQGMLQQQPMQQQMPQQMLAGAGMQPGIMPQPKPRPGMFPQPGIPQQMIRRA